MGVANIRTLELNPTGLQKREVSPRRNESNINQNKETLQKIKELKKEIQIL